MNRYPLTIVLIGVAFLAGCSGRITDSTAAPTNTSVVDDTTTTPSSGDAKPCNGLPFSCAQLVQFGFTYPFARLPSSYLFVNGAIYPYVKITDQLLGDSTIRQPDGSEMSVHGLLQRLGILGQFDTSLQPVLGYGSNPAPAQLNRKFEQQPFAGNVVIPTLKGALKDYDVVWSPHFVSYGAMPATLVPSHGTTTAIWVNWLNSAESIQMNGTEGTGSLYALGTLDGVNLRMPGPAVSPASVYIDCYGAFTVNGRVQSVGEVTTQGRTSRPINESQALRSVLPTLHWKGSLFDLLLANVTSTEGRDSRTQMIAPLGRQVPDPHFRAQIPCSSSSVTAGGGEF